MAWDRSSVDRLFEEQIRPLPESDRLRIAALILQQYADHSPAPALSLADRFENYSDEWSEEDLREASMASWQYVIDRVGDDDA